MKIKLHHLNLCSKDVAGMEDFYRSVLDLEPEPSLNSARDTTQGYAAPVAFVTDGQTQVHLATKDLGVAIRTNHVVNPLERGISPSAPMTSQPSSDGSSQEHPLFRLRPVGNEWLASDLLL